MNDNNIKNQIVSKLYDIYKSTDQFSGMCPSGCNLCEDRETLMLLPYEEEFIREDIEKNKINMFLKDCCGYCYQPIGYSCSMLHPSGVCKVYQKRPYDCRSFPIVPRFKLDKNNSIDFFLTNSYCPILNNLPKNFIKTTIECWRSIVGTLPDGWKIMYNKLNQHCYTNQIPVESYNSPQ